MAFSNFNGSMIAAGLASSPAAPIALVTIAGVTATVAGVVYLHHEFEAYEEKKHREEIEAIIRLHKIHLERIIVGKNNIQGFPAIYKFTTDEKSSKHVESMHLTPDQIDDIGKKTPDLLFQLAEYKELLLNAIKELKKYYKARKNGNDVTAGVLSYLLYTVNTKCLSFQGYDYDIAYLKALTNFIVAYAGLNEKSEHFIHMRRVAKHLKAAQTKLEKHQAMLSMGEILDELRNRSAELSITHNF